MLNNIRIASPCSADWDQMPGDDRIRHCHACDLNVFNLAAFTEREIRELVANREGRLCARIFVRRDGTVLTQNCPVGLRAVTRRISRVAGAILTFIVPNFAAAPLASAQAYTQTKAGDATIEVEVLDPTGAKAPNALVTLTETSRNLQLQGITGKDGRLLLRGPSAGSYTLTVSLRGFQTATQKVELRTGKMLSVPVTLRLGIVGVVVEVDPGLSPNKTILPKASPPAAPSPKPMQR